MASAHGAGPSAQQGVSATEPTPVFKNVPATPIVATAPQAASPPTKQNLKSWWKGFKRSEARSESAVSELPSGIFGVPLRQSITYANVAISLVDDQGQSYIYGYVPIVVAKCGVFLKEKAIQVEGIFRLSGSEKRIKELRTVFDSPDRYGKGLDWAGYTVHDAANVLRRYLRELPEPIVPLNLYERFREPLRQHAYADVGAQQAAINAGEFDLGQTIKTYQSLITELPPLNIQLLLYILDLLAVFASKSDENRMPSHNLAAIFQPGLLSHPQHDMAPAEYRLSQDVLVFLIENQDHFLIGMRGTAADSQTVQDVQNGTPPTSVPTTPNPGRGKSGVVRSASNASAGADSLRKNGGLRRNVSVNSRHSRQSNGAPSPASPAFSAHAGQIPGSGVHRSNTVPTKRSPGLPSGRMQRSPDNRSPSIAVPIEESVPEAENTPSKMPATESTSPALSNGRTGFATGMLTPNSTAQIVQGGLAEKGQERMLEEHNGQAGVATPSKERGLSSLFQRSSPTSDADKKPQNKLRKKKILGSSNLSAHSSTNSLHGPTSSVSPVFAPSQDLQDPGEQGALESTSPYPILSHTEASPSVTRDEKRSMSASNNFLARPENLPVPVDATLRAAASSNSLRSGDVSNTDHSDVEHNDDPSFGAEQRERRRRWRLSRRREDNAGGVHLTSPKKSGADNSTTSIASGQPRKSFTGDSSSKTNEPNLLPAQHRSGSMSHPNDGQTPKEERSRLAGFLKKLGIDSKRDREGEKESTKPVLEGDKEQLQAPKEGDSSKSVDVVENSAAPVSVRHDTVNPTAPIIMKPTIVTDQAHMPYISEIDSGKPLPMTPTGPTPPPKPFDPTTPHMQVAEARADADSSGPSEIPQNMQH